GGGEGDQCESRTHGSGTSLWAVDAGRASDDPGAAGRACARPGGPARTREETVQGGRAKAEGVGPHGEPGRRLPAIAAWQSIPCVGRTVIIPHRVREAADMAPPSLSSPPFPTANPALSAERGRQTPQPDLGAPLANAGAATVGRQ